VAIVLLCFYISFVDVLRHRISDAAIAAISLILFLEGDFELYFFSGFTSLAMFLFVGIVAGLGGGDVKLLVALSLFGIKSNEMATFLLLLTLSTTVLAILTIAARLSLRGNIALAPSICGSYLLLLLSR